ncbi:MAG: DUF87 domain-containing protein [Pseudomonadota bacterium]
MTTARYEKLGAFYLGRAVDEATGDVSDADVLYDSKDLTTHAVIIGMTGSGKTGLGIGMIEEAALDGIPVIAVDPKGDMGNLLLTFPSLAASKFEPWVNPAEAANRGKSVADYAKSQAALWKKGLGEWGQKPGRIKALRDKVDMAIYTPGSNAGLPISVLRRFDAPPEALQADRDLYRERIQATATSVLVLLGIDADPVTSREHILIANILDHCWSNGESLDLPGLIGLIQTPPMEKIGVMDVEQLYPPGERFKLAMALNNLLAAPGFEAWMSGEPLDAGRLLHTETGQPRVSVVSIAHLADAERMFFVCMLLSSIIGWMRAQPGTSSLRAVLYMDEVFGYLPPISNPPSKQLFLTLLKQARAYGLGLVLSTQNPVDLDYKALSNTGTWMIGRLQTERDKARVMEGLEGVAAGADFDRGEMERTLAGLGKRRFLLHNVHESAPVVFNTRWVMSYLAGPMTRDQITTLMGKAVRSQQKAAAAAESKPMAAPTSIAAAAPKAASGVAQFYLRSASGDDADDLVYVPCVLGAAELVYSSARYKVETDRECVALVEPDDGAVAVDWDEATVLALSTDDISKRGVKGAAYTDLPKSLNKASNFKKWTTAYKRWLRNEQVITLFRSTEQKLTSTPDETEGEFRARLAQVAAEKRDLAAAKLKTRYEKKFATLKGKLQRAEQAIERESEQASKKKLDTMVSFGTAILGAVLGRKVVSSTSASKFGTAMKSASGMRKESSDVARAEERADAIRDEISALDAAFEEDIDALDDVYDAQLDELDEIVIKPKSTDIEVHFVAIGWLPFRQDSKGRLRADYE